LDVYLSPHILARQPAHPTLLAVIINVQYFCTLCNSHNFIYVLLRR
jgi:hypothetical protein